MSSKEYCPKCLVVPIVADEPWPRFCPKCGTQSDCDVCGEWHPRPGKCWEMALGPDLTKGANEEIQRVLCEDDSYDCPSDFRAARLGHRGDMRRFRAARSCCGSHEWVAEVLGQRLLLGFNYGH